MQRQCISIYYRYRLVGGGNCCSAAIHSACVRYSPHSSLTPYNTLTWKQRLTTCNLQCHSTDVAIASLASFVKVYSTGIFHAGEIKFAQIGRICLSHCYHYSIVYHVAVGLDLEAQY